MNAADQRKLTPILGAVTLVLGAGVLLLVAGVGRRAHWDPPATLVPLPTATTAIKPLPARPLQQFAMVWQKPLFNPDRQPLARGSEGRSSVGDFTLTGVIITPTLRMALLHDRNSDKEMRIREGQPSADGSVTLVEVRARSAIFDSTAGRVELHLPSGAPIAEQPPIPGTATTGQGQPTDSRAMAAMSPPDAATMSNAGVADGRAMSMQSPDAAHRPPPASVPDADATKPATATSTASSAERIREAILQRRAAQAASSRQGVH